MERREWWSIIDISPFFGPLIHRNINLVHIFSSVFRAQHLHTILRKPSYRKDRFWLKEIQKCSSSAPNNRWKWYRLLNWQNVDQSVLINPWSGIFHPPCILNWTCYESRRDLRIMAFTSWKQHTRRMNKLSKPVKSEVEIVSSKNKKIKVNEQRKKNAHMHKTTSNNRSVVWPNCAHAFNCDVAIQAATRPCKF